MGTTTKKKSFSKLRKDAEDKLLLMPANTGVSSPLEMAHELNVHKVELEMQNDELRATQLKLEASLENYTDLFEFAPVGYFILDKSGVIVNVNDTACQLLGRDKKELVGKPFSVFISSQLIQDDFYRYRHLVNDTGRPQQIESEIKKSDHSVFTALVTSTVVKDEHNQFRYFLTTISDISAQKAAEKALQESEAFNRGILSSLRAQVAVIDPQGFIIAINKSWENFAKEFGVTTLERGPAGSNYFALCKKAAAAGDEMALKALKGIKSVLNRTADIFEMQYPCHSPQKQSWFLMRVILFQDGKPMAVIAHHDISEVVLSGLKLKESEERFRTLIERVSDGFIALDKNWRYTYANNKIGELVHIAPEKLIGKNVWEVFPEAVGSATYDAFYKAMKEQRYISHEDYFEPLGLWQQNHIYPSPDGLSVFIEDITERKRAEASIKASEDIRKLVMDSAMDAIICFEDNDLITVWNLQAETIFGWKESEILNKKLVDIIIPAHYKKVKKIGLVGYLQSVDGLAFSKPFEMTAINRKGEEFPVEVSVVPIRQGDIRFYCAYIRDITDRKKAHEEILRFNERFAMIAATTHDAIWEWNIETDESWANEVHQRLYGLTMEDPVPTEQMWRQRVHPDDRETVWRDYKNALASNKNVWISEYRFQIPGGDYINIYDRSYIVRNSAGKPIRITGSMMDITKRKQSEERIRQQEDRFRSLVDAAPDPIIISDKDGNIQLANLQAVKLFGYCKPELLGSSVIRLMPVKYKRFFNGIVKKFMSNPHYVEIGTGSDLFVVNKEGIEIPVEISLAPFQTAEGILITASIRDITQRKKAEKELEASYHSVRRLTEHLQNIREEERTYIAREIHDELGQQLTVMMMDVAWLEKKIDPENGVAKQKIKELMEILGNTVKTVRRISTELRPSVLDNLGLIAAMEMHLKEFEKRAGIHAILKVPAFEPQLTDPVKNGLFRIFQESLTNVARHSGAKTVMVKLAIRQKEIEMTITDDGAGFDEKAAAAKKTLGVLGMKERAAVIGGQYLITGKPGKGTTILVKIPLQG